jgi:hypothetical protein
MDFSDALSLRAAAVALPTEAQAGLAAPALVVQLGVEVASTLSSALERVGALSATGQIDRAGLRALREEIDVARRAGIAAQQLMRLAGNRVQLADERVELSTMLREAVALRQRECKSHAIQVKQTYADVSLVSDAAVMFSLVESMLDWAFLHARSRVALRLDVQQNPARGRLVCAFLRQHADSGSNIHFIHGQDESLNTFSWRLLQQTAAVLGLELSRHDTIERAEMRLSFAPADIPLALVDDVQACGPAAAAATWHDQPLAGRHVVVLAGQREVRQIVREVLQPTGALLDFVASLEEARQLFEDSLPHAVIHEAALGGPRFERLREELLREVPGLAFIQVVNGHQAFEVLQANGHPYANLGVEGLRASLQDALLFELSRGG